MPSDNSPRHSLIRVWSGDFTTNYGNVVVAEVLRRRVDVMVPTLINGTPSHYRRDFPGAVLIDSDDAIGPVANAIGRGHTYRITIADTDEYAWTPVSTNVAAGNYWTIELVPMVELMRACAVPDSEIIREAHQ